MAKDKRLGIKGNKRLEGESFEKYKIRRATEKRMLKTYLKGRMFWLSKLIVRTGPNRNDFVIEGKGTYRKGAEANA